jgi:excisionase family DNA binding protein
MSSLTVKAVAARYGVTQHTVLAWVRDGSLRAVNVGRRVGAKRPSWRIAPEALAEFEARRVPGPARGRARRRPRARDYVEFY